MERPIILFDTDMESDCDDAGALALLLNACRAGEAQLLGVIADAPGACGIRGLYKIMEEPERYPAVILDQK